MELAAVNSAATRNGGVSIPQTKASSSSQTLRMDWAVLSQQSGRSEELERSKLGQSNERLIYEVKHGRKLLDVDFGTVTIDGGLDDNLFKQRLHVVAKQREELQQMEIKLRAQVIVRSEIVNLQNKFETQIKERAAAGLKLQDKLREREQKIHELERRIEEKERELHAIRLDNEAAWAKEDLIREKNKELQSCRRERDSSEAERMQHIKQIHDLQEHIQEKERQFMEFQEQQRITQEAILFKDEQIREAQVWMTRAQEMDALQSTTNHTLQAELRDRTEQYNQLWLDCQRQLAEMERLHSYMQQLQLELADTKEKNGFHSEGSKMISKDVSQVENDNGSQLEMNGKTSLSAGSDCPPNGNSRNVPANSSGAGGNSLTQSDHVYGIAFAPSPLLSMAAYLPPGQMTALHPFLMRQQGVPQPSHVTQSSFHSVLPMSSIHHWPNPQALLDAEQAPTDEQPFPQQTKQNMMRTDSQYYQTSMNGQVLHKNYIGSNMNVASHADSISPNENVQVRDTIVKDHDDAQLQPQNMQEISSQFHDALRLDSHKNVHATEEIKDCPVAEGGHTSKNTVAGSSFVPDASETPSHAVISCETTTDTTSSVASADAVVSTEQNGNAVLKSVDNFQLDERALLACMARVIGSGGQIKINSTLPNRLAKMLAPLHWYDYKKKYGKLDDFVASHPDLFLVEGEYVLLREGAQEIIAATAAVAKVAAAAADFSSSLPCVAVTPMAQSQRLRNVPLLGTSSDKSIISELQVINHHSQNSSMQNGNMNDGGASNVKWKNHQVEQNSRTERKFDLSQRKGASRGGQHDRMIGASSGMRR